MKKAMYLEKIVLVKCEEGKEVTENIIDIIEGESLENLKEVEELIIRWMESKANENPLSRFENDEQEK